MDGSWLGHFLVSAAGVEDTLEFFECCETDNQLHRLLSLEEPSKESSSRSDCCSDLGPRGCTDIAAAASVLQRTREKWCQRFIDLTTTEPELDWANIFTAKRMLKANIFDQQKAVEMFLQALEFRAKDRKLFQTMHCEARSDMRVIGRDRQEKPIIYMCAGSQTESLKFVRDQFVVTFEAACKITNEDGTVVFVCDMHGLRPHLNLDFMVMKDLADCLGTVFAERIHKIIVVDFSRAAQALWWMLRPMLKETTQRKFAFVGNAQAKEMLKDELDNEMFKRMCDTFDINRDANCTAADQMLHARRTTLCDVPLGPPLK